MLDNIDPIPISNVISALLDNNQPFPRQYLHIFSDMAQKDLDEIRGVWENISVIRKVNLLADLEILLESDTLLAFDDFAKLALTDIDPNVRSKAISLLWESDDSQLAEVFTQILEVDQSEAVQISAAAALGKYILLGELDEIPPRLAEKVKDTLLGIFQTNPVKEIQQEILKSLSYANLPKITRMITTAYNNPDPSWQLTAIIAMGRSADERWEKTILDMINSSSLPHQIEAVKAAGELEISEAKLPLINLLHSPDSDVELRFQIIWSLSKIGGEDVKDTLIQILETTDSDDEIDVIEMALENLEFSDGLPSLDIF